MNRSSIRLLLASVVAALALPAFAGGHHASGATPAVNGNKRSYIVVMEQTPVIAYEGGVRGYAATKPAKGKKLDRNSGKVKKYKEYLEGTQDQALQSAGAGAASKVNAYVYALNGFSALLTEEQASKIKALPGVTRVMPDQMRYAQTDSSPAFLGLTAPSGAYQTGYDGEGVVVGVIDSGIWPEHPSFADNGTYSALPDYAGLPCEFGNTAHNPNDALFTCNNKLLGARQMLTTYRTLIGAAPDEFNSARDDDGHGTHTASTAAGNAGVAANIFGIPRGTISGIAPRARVIAYKGLGNLGGFTSDLAAAIDQAVADGVDVINYSVGSAAGAIGADEIAFLFAADAGVFVATSNGNSGPGAATTGSPATVPWLTSVGASTQSRLFRGSAGLGNSAAYFGASITGGTAQLPLVDAASAGGDLCVPGTLGAAVAGKIVLCRRGAIARVGKSLAVQMAGGAGMILYNNVDEDNLFTDTHWVPSVHVNNTDGLAIKNYISLAGASAVAQINGGTTSTIDAPWMAYFSSRGPNPLSGDIIKPDITAPGVQILAGNSPFPDPGSVPGELFQAIAGTSMSSPHVAGIFALIKQAHPDWSAAIAKSAIMTTAYQDVKKEDGVTPADPFDMGAGHLNPGRPVHKGSAFQPGLAYNAGFIDYLGFLCDAAPEVLSDPAGLCGFLASIGVPTDASDLNLPSIGIDGLPGSQTVQRTVTSVAKENGWREYTVSIDAPPGFAVSVHPTKFRLKRGQTATYHVTISNMSAPAGEWRHGSLTWNDKTGHYTVRSPISVNASLFSAPATITGSGASGSASFDVGFGYTGSYSAAAHGLEPAIVTSDTVVQDPDQTFSPGDGFSNLHQFNVSGAALLRVKLPPESVASASIDLDIFLYNPSGALVASSTNAATNEEIEIVLPADGTWKLYVHGWNTQGPSAAYDLFSWIVSLTPGGNMSIASAPASAAIGTTGTVGVSWSGATAGQWHYGAVSHTGSSGLLGLTRVEVDNR